MATTSNQSQDQPILTGKQIARTIFFLLLFGGLTFGSAGTLNWWEGWAFIIIGIVIGTILARIHLAYVNPDLIRERASYDEKEDAKSWDRILVPLVAIIGPLAALIVAGLDYRFGWSTGPELWVKVAAMVVLLLSSAFGHWAVISNRFFAAVVRIQTDRGHEVCDTGPYRIMRHPAYAAAILYYIATPLLLGSWWSFIPVAVIVVATIVRTALEDRTLRDELPGYEEFTQRTRFRLLPGIW